MTHIHTPGILLKKFTVGEQDTLATWLTPDHGKITTKIRGAKKITSKFNGHLEYFNLCDLIIYKKQNRSTLTQCQANQNFQELKKKLTKIDLSFTVLQLINNLTYSVEISSEFFYLLKETIEVIESTQPEKLSTILPTFQLKIIQLLGVCPNFQSCSHCQQKFAEDHEIFLEANGSIICDHCHKEHTLQSKEIDFNTIKLCNFLTQHHLAIIAKLNLTTAQINQFNEIIETILTIHFQDSLQPIQDRNYKSVG